METETRTRRNGGTHRFNFSSPGDPKPKPEQSPFDLGSEQGRADVRRFVDRCVRRGLLPYVPKSQTVELSDSTLIRRAQRGIPLDRPRHARRFAPVQVDTSRITVRWADNPEEYHRQYRELLRESTRNPLAEALS